MAEGLEDRALLASLELTLEDASHDEGQTTYYFAKFHAKLIGAVAGGFQVSYHTADGTAENVDGDFDYYSQSGTLEFAGTNNETHDVEVMINYDRKVELDEDFTLSLDEILPPEGSMDPAPA